MSPVIELDDVSFRYDGPMILENVSLTVEQGEFLGVVGPNGGGKTTLLKLMLGLLDPIQGAVRIMGELPSEARRAIGYVPQFVTFRRDFPISVEETVLLGRLGLAPMFGGYSKQIGKPPTGRWPRPRFWNSASGPCQPFRWRTAACADRAGARDRPQASASR